MEQDLALPDNTGEILFNGPVSFLKGCVKPEHFPEEDRPEVAFIGRSNVGKSSLINALVNQKNLARTSNTPGRTREINFFEISPSKAFEALFSATSSPLPNGFYLVDLPGYGYAAGKAVTGTHWEKVCSSYLSDRRLLKCCYVLIDARHGFKPSDLEMCRLLDQWACSYQLIFTKADKLTGKEKNIFHQTLLEHIQKLQESGSLIACRMPFIITSSRKRTSISELQNMVFETISI